MIDDGIGKLSPGRAAEASKAATLPDGMHGESAASELVGELPRDIARKPPRDIARDAAPIRDIARDATAADTQGARDAYRDALWEKLRDQSRDAARDPAPAPMPPNAKAQARDPLLDLLNDVTAREPPRPVLPPAGPPAARTDMQPPVAAGGARSSLWAVVVVILGLAGAGLMAWQLSLLQGQMADLRAAVEQNGKIADAVSRLSDSATQANEIAGQALASSTRPWIGVDAIEAGPIEAGQPLTIEVRVRNSGRTPSTDVQGLFLVYISPINNPPALLTDQCTSCVRGVVLPNGVVSYKLSVRENVMSADEVQRIKDGKDTMWIVGRLDYRDGEGESHTTRSCLYYRATGISSFTACGDGNSAN